MSLMASSYKVLQKGSRAPEFSLPGIDGKTYTLASFAGCQALLIVFMCNHCPYVVPKMDLMRRLQDEYLGRGLRIAGINPNDAQAYPEDGFGKMVELEERHPLGFPYLRDEDQSVAKAYGAVCTPDPFLFGPDMRLRYHGRFDDAHGKHHEEARTDEMRRAIEDVLSGRQVSVPTLPSMGCSIKWKGQGRR